LNVTCCYHDIHVVGKKSNLTLSNNHSLLQYRVISIFRNLIRRFSEKLIKNTKFVSAVITSRLSVNGPIFQLVLKYTIKATNCIEYSRWKKNCYDIEIYPLVPKTGKVNRYFFDFKRFILTRFFLVNYCIQKSNSIIHNNYIDIAAIRVLVLPTRYEGVHINFMFTHLVDIYLHPTLATKG
jgi:hypothetical protein